MYVALLDMLYTLVRRLLFGLPLCRIVILYALIPHTAPSFTLEKNVTLTKNVVVVVDNLWLIIHTQ